MKPIYFEGHNVVFAKDQPEYQPLPGFKNDSPEGEFISCWALSNEEIELIGRTGRIWLSQMTFNRPLTPVFVAVKKSEVLNVASEDFNEPKPFPVMHLATTHFGFWDRIKILFGQPIYYSATINVDRECMAMPSENGHVHIPEFIQNKKQGFAHTPKECLVS